jgi:ferredoxin-NADP reductase
VTLVAGGIGLTPLRALVEELSAAVPVTLLYRAHDATDLIFRRELDLLAERRGVTVRYLVGPRRARRGIDGDDPLGRASIAAMVPDIADHDVYVCGPPGLMTSVTRTLRSLGVPPHRIHQERFDT